MEAQANGHVEAVEIKVAGGADPTHYFAVDGHSFAQRAIEWAIYRRCHEPPTRVSSSWVASWCERVPQAFQLGFKVRAAVQHRDNHDHHDVLDHTRDG
ncbi:MAG: hypothetical protein U0165_04045 [Polyangiaceae bacterium]